MRRTFMSLSVSEFYKPLPDIVVFGKMRSGKDEFCKIVQTLGFDVQRVAFGDPMKVKFFEMFPHIPQEPKPIKDIIHFGQSMRVIDPDIWVKLTIGQLKMNRRFIEGANLEPTPAIFTDVRQHNEYDACKQLGAVMVKLEVPEHIRVERMLKAGETVSEGILTASTETKLELFPYDYKITNNGSRDDFTREIVELIYKIKGARK